MQRLQRIYNFASVDYQTEPGDRVNSPSSQVDILDNTEDNVSKNWKNPKGVKTKKKVNIYQLGVELPCYNPDDPACQ